MAQSAFDRRRINGPEESWQPVLSPKSQTQASARQRQKRKPQDIRPIFLQAGLVTQSNGSAYIEAEQTKIVCAVYGPRQSKNLGYHEKGKLNVEVKFAPFSCQKRRAPLKDAEDRTISLAIHQAISSSIRLELFPKSIIDVFLTVIESDGIEGSVAAGSVAASTALADAGIELFGLVVSCSAAILYDEIWLDPTEEESSRSQASVVLSCMPALSTVTAIWQTGQMPSKQLFECMDACQQQCTLIHSRVAQALLENRENNKD